MKYNFPVFLFGLLFSLSTAAEKPNIVFIIADDLGWADVEFHEGNVPTPNLNRLLAEGITDRNLLFQGFLSGPSVRPGMRGCNCLDIKLGSIFPFILIGLIINL